MAIILLACRPCVVIINCWDRFCTLGRTSRTKETLPDFHEWCRVTRHPRIFRRLTGCQRDTPVLGRHKCSTLSRSDSIGRSEPDPGCSITTKCKTRFFFLQKCRDPNPLPDLNGGSKPEPGLLRPFSYILSKNILFMSFHFTVFNYAKAFQMVGP